MASSFIVLRADFNNTRAARRVIVATADAASEAPPTAERIAWSKNTQTVVHVHAANHKVHIHTRTLLRLHHRYYALQVSTAISMSQCNLIVVASSI